ncbi:MAG: hypothetical protein H7287_12060 [Thermoleophilia bacterium]|nr:hypothetical protein [Thermoleophilia bacterium]
MRPLTLATAGLAVGGLAALGALGYSSERGYLDSERGRVRVATPYDLGKLTIEAGTMTGGLLFGAVLSQPLRGSHLRGLAVAVGCMGAAGLAYRGAAMLARHEHNLSRPDVRT